jgi:hypothetical protein
MRSLQNCRIDSQEEEMDLPRRPIDNSITLAPATPNEHSLSVRIRAEYREMPGLSLTLPQACRFWQIDEPTCARILETLVDQGVLRRTPRGAFVVAADTVR